MVQCRSCNFDNTDDAKTCQNCGTALNGVDAICGIPTFAGSSVNQVLDRRYIIACKIALSQIGVTYKAEDAELNIQVILRVLLVTLCDSTQQIDYLRSKAEALIGLSHVNIISLLGFGLDAQIKYLVSECVQGETLQDRISTNGPLAIEETLRIFEPIAAGLDYAHSQNILHGDIRPENITLADDGQVKLDNFCLTRQISDSLTSLGSEQVSSSSLYVAPEQFHNRQLSPQSDIYSLAACIYQCLCSSPSFWRGWLEYQVLKESPAILDNLTDRQNETLQKAFSRNPQDRQSSAGELLFELLNEPAETIVEVEAETAPDTKDKTSKPISKPKILAAILTLIILVLIAIFFGVRYSRYPKHPENNAITQQTTSLWTEALLSAEQEDYSNAVFLANEVMTKSAIYAKEQKVSQLKTTWEQTLSAQNLWTKTKALAGAGKYEQAIIEAKKLIDQYPKIRYSIEAEAQLTSWKKIISTTQEVTDLTEKTKVIKQEVADLAEKTKTIKLETKTEIEEQIRVAKVEEFKKLKNNAIALEDAEDWENAAKVYAQAMKIKSDDTEIEERWARCLNNLYLSRTRAAEQAKLRELMDQVIAFEVAQDWENAISLYTQGIENNPDNAEIKEKLALSQHNLYLSKALAAEKEGNWNSAVELYDKALSYDNNPLTQQKQEAVREKIWTQLQVEQNSLKLGRWLKLASKAEEQGEFAKAIKSYEKATEQGSSLAIYRLGLIYHNGTGVDRDYIKAMELFTTAAKHGEDIAMLAMATMYYDGLGVDKDYDKAFQWYQQAGQKGNSKAMLNLGIMYSNGEGVSKDYTKANMMVSTSC